MLKVDFSMNPPSRGCLSRILKSVQWDSSEKGIDFLINYQPHPSLMPLWAILTQKGRVIGFATLYLPPPQSLQTAPVFIANFAIEDVLHRGGMGSFLLEKIESWCSQMQVKILALQTVESSITFFMSKGFCKNDQHADIFLKRL
jgi:hypothetical protein